MGNLLMGPINVMIGNVLTIAIIAAIVYYVLWDIIIKKLEQFLKNVLEPIVEDAVKDVGNVAKSAGDSIKNAFK